MSIKVRINNLSGKSDEEIYIMPTGSGSTAIGVGKSVSLKSIKQADNSYSFDLTSLSSGRIYVSYGKLPDNQMPDEGNSGLDSYYTRYDKMELTYPAGEANLTSVDSFAIPLELKTFKSNVLQTSFSLYLSANDMITKLSALSSGNAKVEKDGVFIRVNSPTKSGADYDSMQAYVDSVAKAGISFNVKGTYFGTAGAIDYNYAASVTADGTISLTADGEEKITIPGDTLADAIYSCNGAFKIGSATHHVSENTVQTNVYRDVISGFNFGYENSKYASNIKENSNAWWTQLPFSDANSYYNKYAEVIYNNSDAYGFPFSDLRRKVLAGLDDIDTLEITILPDDMLSAPTIKSKTITDTSVTLKWDAVNGASSYKIRQEGKTDVQTVSDTSISIDQLDAGTAYTFYISSIDGTKSSPERRISLMTSGTASPVSGSYAFSVTLYFLPNTKNTVFSLNGDSHTIAPKSVPAQGVSLSGKPNSTNEYAFSLTTEFGVFKSTLRVQLSANAITGYSMSNNKGQAFNMSNNNINLSIQPLSMGDN